MSYTSNYNLNIRLSALESKINTGVPTSSDLADVLLNGNTAGTTDIDMNLQSITNATSFESADNGNSIDVDGSSATLTIADNLGNINVITAIGSSVPSPNADSILTTSTTSNAIFYPAFLGATTGYNSAGVNTSLTFNPSTKTETLTDGVNSTVISPTGVSSTTFTGSLSGNATSSTNIAGGLGGSIPYQSAVNNTAFLANGTSGQYLKSNGTTLAPSWDTVSASDLNNVLAIGNTATNKTIYMFNTNELELNGDNIIMSNAINPGRNSTLTYDELNINNGASTSVLSATNLNITDNTGSPTINYTELSNADLKITGSSTSINNTLTPISSTIADATNTSALSTNLLSMYLTGSSSNSLSSSNLSNTALNIYNSASLLTYSSLTSGGLTFFDLNNVKNVMTNVSSTYFAGASTTQNKNTISSSGFAIVGITTNNTITTSATSVILTTAGYKNTITSGSITQVPTADPTINNSVLTNTGLTLTGALTTTTNTISALQNVITDATRTLTSGIISSVATFKALAGGVASNSTTITPNSIINRVADNDSTINYFSSSSTATDMIGSAASYFIKTRVPVNSGTYGYSLNIGNQVTSGISSFLTNAYICLESAGTGPLLTSSVPSILFKRTHTTIGVGDTIGLINFAGNRSGATQEYARISGICRQRSSTLDDGSILLQVAVNSNLTNFLDINGDVDKIVAYKPIILDTTGGTATTNINNITSTDMTITGSGTSITNTISALQSIITDGTRTLTSGIISSVATFKALALSGGNSTTITPSSIITSSVDGTTTTNTSSMTTTGISTIGTADNYFCKITPNSGTAAVDIRSLTDFGGSNTSGMLSLTTTNAIGTGITQAPSILFRRFNNAPIDSAIGTIRFTGFSNGSSSSQEYSRITTFVKNQGLTNNDGNIQFQTAVDSVLATRFEINGDENQINAFQPLDMNNNAIVSSTGGITLNASGSAGTGVISLTTKDGTAGTGTGLVLSGNTLTLSTSAPNVQAPAHLCLYLPDPLTGVSTLYKIQLLT